MNWLGTILTTIIVAGVYYMLVMLINNKYELQLPQRGNWVVSKSVMADGIFTILAVGIISYFRFPEFTIWEALLILVLIVGMSVLALIDVFTQRVPNKYLLLLALIWIAIVGVFILVETQNGLAHFFRACVGGIIGGLIFLLCYLLSGRKLGAGDVKLVFIMGLYLTGQRIIGAIFYGTLLCCIWSIVLLCRKKIGLKDGVPMVPFLYLGVVITLFIM